MALFWGFSMNAPKPTLLDLASILALLGVLYRVREAKKAGPCSCDPPANAAASSSKPTKRPLTGHEDYDVFISYRGTEVKADFVDHLQEALTTAGFSAFVDAKDVSEGDLAWTSIAHAIRAAPVCVPVFTRAYAESKACLEELCLMLSPAKVLLPCFHDITPTDVMMPDTGALKHGLLKLKQRHSLEKLAQYQAALSRAAKVALWECEQMNGRDLVVVKRVVSRVQEVLDKKPLNSFCRYQVGLDEREAEVLELLRIGPAVRVIGIVGPGGIGKTTVCKAIYEHASHLFCAVSYVEDVREKAKQPRGLVGMQQQIIHDLCKLKDLRIDDLAHGRALIKEHLRGSIKVLIILDDADDPVQVENLMLPESLGYGSRGIVTSRDKWFVSQLETNEIYEVRELTEAETLHLFCWHAFLKEQPPHGFEKIATEVALACGRVPLEVEVVGAHLCGEKDPGIWGEVLTKLRLVTLVPEEKTRVNFRLHISYDALPHDQQEMFLDIACVLLEETAETAKRAWVSSGWSTKALRHLIDKSLVRLDCCGRFMMHDLLRDLGRGIAGKDATRLWMPDAEIAVKINFKAQGLSLHGSKSVFPAHQFGLMKDLRILLVNGATGKTFSYFPKALTLISWQRMPFYYIPGGILALDKLAVLNLGWSKIIHLFDESKDKEMPCSISHLRALQELNLRGCERLERLPESIGQLTRLEKMDLSLCTILKSVPSTIGGLAELTQLDLSNCLHLQCLPESIGKLTDLQELLLDNCERLKALPESIGNMAGLRKLHLSGCKAVVYVPSSLGRLTCLQELSLSAKGLEGLPPCLENLLGLRHLELFEIRPQDRIDFAYKLVNLQKLYLSKIEKPPVALADLAQLKKLFLSLVVDVKALPPCVTQLRKLQELYLNECAGLKSLPWSIHNLTALTILDITNCDKLADLPDNVCHMTQLQELRLNGCRGLRCLPESITELSELCRATLSTALRINSVREGKLGNYLRMLADLNLACQAQPCNAAILTERSVAKRLLNDYSGALEDLDAAHLLSPSFSSTLVTRGRVKYLMGDFSSALADLDVAHSLNPNDGGKILSMRRVVKVMLGDCQEVLNELNRTLELYPEDGFFLLERGVVKTYMNQLREAMTDLDGANTIMGETFEVAKHRAYVKHLLGDDKRARALALRAKQLRPLCCHEGVTCLAELPVKFMEYFF